MNVVKVPLLENDIYEEIVKLSDEACVIYNAWCILVENKVEVYKDDFEESVRNAKLELFDDEELMECDILEDYVYCIEDNKEQVIDVLLEVIDNIDIEQILLSMYEDENILKLLEERKKLYGL